MSVKKPVSAHIANGTYRPYRYNQSGEELEYLDSVPECPSIIRNESTRQDWDLIVSDLVKNHLVLSRDLRSLINCFQFLDAANDIYQLIEEAGGIKEYSKNYSVKDGLKDLKKDWADFITKYNSGIKDFGVTPAGRKSNTPSEKKKKADEGEKAVDAICC